MRFLVVDTADARGSVALITDSEILHLEAHTTEEDYSSWLLPAANRTLAQVGVTHSQLDGYAVCNGPGSFTGLRVGLTTVKAWAEIHRKPVAAVSRLDCLVLNPAEFEPPPEPYIASVFDARRDQVFAALYRQSQQGLARIGDELVIAPSDFLARITEIANGQPVRWRTPDPQALTALPNWTEPAQRGHVIELTRPPFADRLARLALRKFLNGETQDALSLDAEYVRRSDAEIFWKGNPSAFRP